MLSKSYLKLRNLLGKLYKSVAFEGFRNIINSQVIPVDVKQSAVHLSERDGKT